MKAKNTKIRDAAASKILRKLVRADLKDFIPYSENARNHTDQKIEAICHSYKRHGVINPIVVDENNIILAGHGRYLAAQKLNLKRIPAIRIVRLTNTKKKSYRLADNKLALMSSWDKQKLTELEQLIVLDDLSAHELEQTIGKALRKDVLDILDLDPSEEYRVIDHIKNNSPEGDELAKSCVQKIIVGQEILTIEISPEHLRDFLEEKLKLAIPSRPERPLYILPAPFSTTRANKGSIIMSTKNSGHDPLDLPPYQLRNLVRGIVWRDEHFDGMSIEDIAAREGLSKSGVRKIIMGSFETLMAL